MFAGKAHPADEPAQWMMREIQRISSLPPFIGKILLCEGYDLGIGRLLTSGVDVWLNTPVHPLEASGTSGMKAAINGTVNLSVLDGWWAEAYDGRRGSRTAGASRRRTTTQGDADRDRQDSTTLYEILQDEVIPLYYARDERLGYSPDWVAALQALDGERAAGVQQRARAARLLAANSTCRPRARAASMAADGFQRRARARGSGRKRCAPRGPA